MKLNFNCPKCGGNLVKPSEIFDNEYDGVILICDGEVDGSGCDFFIMDPNIKEENRVHKFFLKLLKKKTAKELYNEKVHNIFDVEFRQLAYLVTGVEWDFSKLLGDSCCVKGCFYGREYGYWTCKKHRQLELDHFNPVYEGTNELFYSHRGKA